MQADTVDVRKKLALQYPSEVFESRAYGTEYVQEISFCLLHWLFTTYFIHFDVILMSRTMQILLLFRSSQRITACRPIDFLAVFALL